MSPGRQGAEQEIGGHGKRRNSIEQNGKEKHELVILLTRGVWKVSVAYIKWMTGWSRLHESITRLSHPLRIPSATLRLNTASPLYSLQPVTLRYNTSAGLLSHSMSYKKFFVFFTVAHGGFSEEVLEGTLKMCPSVGYSDFQGIVTSQSRII